jgi:hypothetical protein
VKKAASTDDKFSAFVLGIVNSPAFQMAKAEPVRTTENGGPETAAPPVAGAKSAPKTTAADKGPRR